MIELLYGVVGVFSLFFFCVFLFCKLLPIFKACYPPKK